jgi:hypothetical protein
MAKGYKRALHGVDVVENVGKIDSNFYELTTSNIVGSNSNFENMAVGNLAFGNVAPIIEVA